jgi:hypothetical protein
MPKRQSSNSTARRKSSGLLTQRALNRATLARQFLLERQHMPALATIEHLVGMQAQAPNSSYVGLWTRLSGFQHAELAQLISGRGAVRVTLMRGTIHLVSARDCLALRPLMQPMLARLFSSSPFRRNVVGVDLEELFELGRALLEEQPRSRAELSPLLAKRWPNHDAESLAYALSYLLPLVQVPPRGIWGSSGPATWTTVEAWLGRELDPTPSLSSMVLRYLAAFGPASVMDIQAWSGLTRLSEVVEQLRPQLRSFHDEQDAELFDLPDAPRPDPDTPALPRFLPEYDNILLSHADRSRVISDGRNPPLYPGNGGVLGTILIDGFFRATWKISQQKGSAALTIEPFAPLSAIDRDALDEEGARLLAFVAGDAHVHDVQFAPPPQRQDDKMAG